jgi:hypothetical protein
MDANLSKVKRGRWKLILVIAMCAAPLVLSYFTYYVIKPEGRTNYGALLDPSLYQTPQELIPYRGKWVMLQVSASDCEKACQNTLLNMRQLWLMQGKDRDRIERVALMTGNNPLETSLLKIYDGTHFLPSSAKTLETRLPAEEGSTIYDRIYLIDPLGNLMMRYSADADPNKIKKDITKLLKASSIG